MKLSHFFPIALLAMFAFSILVDSSVAEDWNRFRGSNGSGIAESKVPTTWDETKNIRWKFDLPGFGSSSPIVSGKKIFVTCYSGYGTSRSGDMSKLVRHLVCVDAETGKEIWAKKIGTDYTEDSYRGYISEHGYASNTPVTDGKMVYAFFGKGGVHAFDLDGEKKWTTQVGKSSSNRRWGSGSSLILHDNKVIVNAADEGRALVALDKTTGKEVWKTDSDMFELAFGTPSIVKGRDDKSEIVLAVPGEVWAMNPANGKLRWYAETSLTGNVSPSPLVVGSRIFLFGGYQSSGSYAIDAGGKGDVTNSKVVWKTRTSSYVATPIHVKGKLYWVDDRGIANCLDAKTGKTIYKSRVDGLKAGGRPVYASPILANDKIYVVTRRSGTLVIPVGDEFKIEKRNVIASDDTDFNATPAVIGNKLILRSNRSLYCIEE